MDLAETVGLPSIELTSPPGLPEQPGGAPGSIDLSDNFYGPVGSDPDEVRQAAGITQDKGLAKVAPIDRGITERVAGRSVDVLRPAAPSGRSAQLGRSPQAHHVKGTDSKHSETDQGVKPLTDLDHPVMIERYSDLRGGGSDP